MSFWSNPFRSIRRIVQNPAKAVKQQIVKKVVAFVKNPAKKVVNVHIRRSRIYKNIGRPIIKIGVAAAVGAATGGISLAANGVSFVGFSSAGALAAAGGSAVSGGLTNKAFQPVHDIALPAVAGVMAGNAARYDAAVKSGNAALVKDLKNTKLALDAVKVGKTIDKTVKTVEMIRRGKRDIANAKLDFLRSEQVRKENARSEQELQALIAKRDALKRGEQTTMTGIETVKKSNAAIFAAGGLLAFGGVGAVIGGLVGYGLDKIKNV